jgi:recombination protein RecA
MPKIIRYPRLPDGFRDYKGVNPSLIEKVIKKINKEFKRNDDEGVEIASTLANSVFSLPRAFVSSGIMPLDCILYFGRGFPTAIVEIYGGEATGKTAVAEMTLAESQRRGYYTIWISTEYSIETRRVKSVGLNEDEVIILDAETMEDVYDELKKAVRIIREDDESTPIVAVWDTVASSPSRTELDEKKGLGDPDMGKSGLLMSRFFRRLMRFLFKNKVCLLCLNQTRSTFARFGSKESTYGGKALRFYASIRLKSYNLKYIKGPHGEIIGQLCVMECVKNKVAPPRRKCVIPIYWNRGIDVSLSAYDYAIQKGVIKRKGTGFRFRGEVVTRNSFMKYYPRHKQEFDTLLQRTTVEQ